MTDATEIPYEPPRREFADTLLAFRDFEMASAWGVRVEPDPLGPVNKIVSLRRGGRRVKSVLCPVPVGAKVQLVRDDGGYTVDELFALKSDIWARRPYGPDTFTAAVPPRREPGWRVEVDDKTVLAVTDAELRPPIPPKPRVPLRQRIRRAVRARARAWADQIAGQLGYHRADECGGDW